MNLENCYVTSINGCKQTLHVHNKKRSIVTMTDSAPEMERILVDKINKEVRRCILARRDDIEKTFEGENPYILMETYASYTATDPAKKGAKKMAPFVTITPHAKYEFARVFTKLIAEAKNVGEETASKINAISISDDERKVIEASYPKQSDREEVLRDLLLNKRMRFVADEANEQSTLCIASYMYKVISGTNIERGSVLYQDRDPAAYFATKVQQLLKDFKEVPTFVTAVAALYQRFLKCVSARLCDTVWEDHRTVNDKLLNGILRALGEDIETTSEILYELKSSHPVPVRRKQAKKGGSTPASPATKPVAADTAAAAPAAK